MLDKDIIISSDKWLDEQGPKVHVVISSRSRLARNIEGYTYAPYAKKEELQVIAEKIDSAIKKIEEVNHFYRLSVPELNKIERHYLTESRVISKELEKSGEHRYVYLSEDKKVSIMVNEEDHLRMQCLLGGLQLRTTFEIINVIDDYLSQYIDYAFSEKYGYLTACPTNTGTGLRVSVMVHLPGLAVQDRIKEIVEMIQPLGLAVRGFHGENSGFEGDFYQISNEITLGKTEEEILETLQQVIERIIEREEEARAKLFEEHKITVEDIIWRSYALLSYARKINSVEALQLLSRIRLGIDRGLFPELTHQELNRLIVEIQPAHMLMQEGANISASERDVIRAEKLRMRFQSLLSQN